VIELLHGDCLERLKELPDCSVDACVTDPPYGLSFMGKAWDYDVPGAEVWREVLRVLKPGGHLLAFAGTRTQHRMAVQIEDAGFEIRDMIAWVYGSGFPKSLDVSKAIDKHGGASVAWFGPWFRKWRTEHGITQKQVAALFPSKTGGLTGCVANWELGFNLPTPDQFNLIRDTFGLPFDSIEAAEREAVAQQRGTVLAVAPGQDNDRSSTTLDITAPATPEAQQWAGWGTALKPALEPITVARKPFKGTVAANVLKHGTGAINVDGCRVGTTRGVPASLSKSKSSNTYGFGATAGHERELDPNLGRWPANLIHDGSDEVVGLFPETVNGGGFKQGMVQQRRTTNVAKGAEAERVRNAYERDSGGSAARFFYCAKASKADRGDGNGHPTVKPTELMRYLCRLVTPPGGVVLDPFMGSGSTGKAAALEGFRFIGIEREAEYLEIARQRVQAGDVQGAFL
jgi:transcriptional regulator with XRE-family HTH domain